MKFNSTASMIMCKIFSAIAGVSFLILLCVSDIPVGQESRFVLLIFISLLFALLAVVAFDSRIIFRHLFAIRCIVVLSLGLIFKNNSRSFRLLVEEALEEDCAFDFYRRMVSRY